MSHIRAILAMIGGGALGLLAAELILGLGPRDAGLCIAVIAACVIGIFLVRAIQRDRQRQRDKARHPSVRYWTADWREILGPGEESIEIQQERKQ